MQPDVSVEISMPMRWWHVINVSITLTRGQWVFIADQLESDTPIYEELGDAESMQLGRAALDRIRPHI